MKQRSNKGLIIGLVISIILLLGLGCYVVYDKDLLHLKKETSNDIQTPKEENEVKELDINSRLVQTLYNKVSSETEESNWNHFWYYSSEQTKDGALENFDVKTSSEIVKMQLVAKNLVEENKKIITCSDYNIPDYAPKNSYLKEDRFSLCYTQKEDSIYHSNIFYFQYGYKKDYVESIYKELFGPNSKLNTDVPIYTDCLHISSYNYLNATDMYFEYTIEGGGTNGPGGYTAKIAKATQDDEQIKIYETVDEYNDEKAKVDTYTFVYTFKLEKDGMYSFVSRMKES